MSSALAAASNGGTKMPDLALAEAAAAADRLREDRLREVAAAGGASPTRSEEDEELNAAAAEAVRNLKSDDDEDDEVVRGENGDNEHKGLKDEMDAGENKEKQVSQTFSLKSNNSLMNNCEFCGQNHTRQCNLELQQKVCCSTMTEALSFANPCRRNATGDRVSPYLRQMTVGRSVALSVGCRFGKIAKKIRLRRRSRSRRSVRKGGFDFNLEGGEG